MEKYTVRQSVRDTLSEIPWGRDFTGRYFLSRCRSHLAKNGSPAKPFDSTLLRDLRHYRGEFQITVVDHQKSIYHKGDYQPCLING